MRYVIVGGGILGLATARQLGVTEPRRDVVPGDRRGAPRPRRLRKP
ncbi:MAG TPA: hypothetical protein VLC49_01820 [Solirubrobacteraceae bacterium]|nr:hypothetical protein [Solirubrobacteraceae bacterium]